MIKVLIWLLSVLIAGIIMLVISIIYHFKVLKDLIKKEGLEEYQDKGEWLN